jgi:hypothetical protein
MRLRRWSLIAAIFLLSSGLYGQSTDSPCPSITVTGPAGMIGFGDAAQFSASVDGLESLIGIGYEWSVNEGTIVEGQGTSAISVRTTKENQGANITVTVQVTGIPVGCTTSASEVARVAPMISCGLPVDEYGPVLWLEEQARLDNFLIQLTINKRYRGYFHIRIGPTENSTTIKKHIERILNHVRSRDPKFDLSRLIFAIEEDVESTRVTRLMAVSPEAALPECTGCTVQNGRDLLPRPTPRMTTRTPRSKN